MANILKILRVGSFFVTMAELTKDYAAALDAADSLAHLRKDFFVPINKDIVLCWYIGAVVFLYRACSSLAILSFERHRASHLPSPS